MTDNTGKKVCPHCSPDKYPITGTPIYGCSCLCHTPNPADKQLDEIFKYALEPDDKKIRDQFMSYTEAKAALQQWRDDEVVAELDFVFGLASVSTGLPDFQNTLAAHIEKLTKTNPGGKK